MKTTIKRAASGVLACGLLVLSLPFASALEYRYDADLYDNHFYTPTSSNHALDLDSKDDSGGSTIVVPSGSMGTEADQTTPRTGSPIIPVGSYIDRGAARWKADRNRRNAERSGGLSFNRLEGMGGGYTAQSQLTTTNGHFGAVSIGSRGSLPMFIPALPMRACRKAPAMWTGQASGTAMSPCAATTAARGRISVIWKYVQVGDVVTYKTSLGTRTYRVTFAGRILATDTDVLNPTADNQITMLTCIANEPAYRFCVIGQEIR